MRNTILIATLISVLVGSLSTSKLLASLWAYDKHLHIATYALLFVVCRYCFLEKRPLSIAAFLTLFGMCVEIAQAFTGRSMDFGDVGANTVGVTVAYLTSQFFYGYNFGKSFMQ